MGKGYRHLSLEDRDTISEMKRQGHTMEEIAAAGGRSKSTISRELRRNSTPAYKVYLPCKAHERAVVRKRESGKRPGIKDERIVSYVRDKLALDWSPELIAGRIGQDMRGAGISHEAIYRYIYHTEFL